MVKELTYLIVGDPKNVAAGVMPVITVLALNCSTDGFFSTKSFTVRCLEAIQHPYYGDNVRDDLWGEKRFRMLNRTPEGILRPAFENGLVNRRSLYIVIDESQHVQYAKGGEKSSGAILDSWKCMAERAGVVLVLVGAYPLLNVIKLCTHFIGRKRQIHLPRYRYIDADYYGFGQILEAYSEVVQLPPNVSSLVNWSEVLYDVSFGCIGLLEGWLREALAMVEADDDSYLTFHHILETRKPKSELEMLAKEIRDGEELLSSDEMLVFYANKTSEPLPESSKSDDKNKSKKKSKRKPFEKNPKRYPIKGRD